jgi:poly-beta-1,6-N-acetyl-D-glucosamine synthase
MQSWDYLLGIASVKREQSLMRGTLVAQGVFSVYRTDAVGDAGGWPDMIGEAGSTELAGIPKRPHS